MIAGLLVLLAAAVARPGAVPSQVTVASARGEVSLPVRLDAAGTPRLSGTALAGALGTTLTVTGSWAELKPGGEPLRLLLGASLFWYNGSIEPLAATAELVHDTVFVPLQLVAEILPRHFGDRFSWDAAAARLTENTKPVATALVAPKPAPGRAAAPAANGARSAARSAAGLRRTHLVVVDPGHGGVDPGNPGMYFPAGVREKDVTLAVGKLLRDELQRQGVTVEMTRTTDTLIALGDRGPECADDCDLFVSVHVNSLPRRRGFTAMRGFETYFLAEARTEDARRVAQMENEAVRYEAANDGGAALGGLDFILKDLMTNEHLRESGLAAELVQEKMSVVHSGPNRGVKQAGFMVLTTARRPAILVEMGYSTNPEDSRQMTTASGQRALAGAIADAVVEYLRRYEAKTGAP